MTTTAQQKLESQKATCVLTVQLYFADRADAEDAVDMMEHCIVDALAVEPSIRDL